ncbi:hypothetical protein BDQ17DRAFT_1431173 [Cyathus striatus]|nr:hypothetical protein BDQ17DRAFT_1431173 [Cyathus striatus]
MQQGDKKEKSMSHVLVDASEDEIAVDEEWEDMGSLQFEKSQAYIECAKGSPLDIVINASIPEDRQGSDHPDHSDYQPLDPESKEDEGNFCEHHQTTQASAEVPFSSSSARK